MTVNLRFAEPACGAATISATGCARAPGRVDVIDRSGSAASTTPIRTISPGVRQLTTVLDVPTVTTTWNVLLTLDYVGPCGPAPVTAAIRYQLAVSPNGSVLLSGVNGSTGSLRRPQPSDPAWLATIEPYRFPNPEPGCTP